MDTFQMTKSGKTMNIIDVRRRIENNPNGLECRAEANMIKLYRLNIKT